MTIKPLTKKDVSSIVRLHRENLPQTHSSKLGIVYLTQLYSTVAATSDIHIGYVAYDNKHVIGVITATLDLQKSQQKMTKSFTASTYLLVLTAILKGKLSPWGLVRQIWFEFRVTRIFPTPYSTVLTLFVVASYRRKGIGKQLVNKVIGTIKEYQYPSLFVDTQVQNEKALYFYQALGFTRRTYITDAVVLSYDLSTK